MAHYTLKDIDDPLWHHVKIMVAMDETTIKKLIVDFLEKSVVETFGEAWRDKRYFSVGMGTQPMPEGGMSNDNKKARN